MATLSIEKLKAALEGAEGDEIEIDGLLSKEEVNEIVRDRLAREKPKQSELEQKLAQEQRAKSELEAKLKEITEAERSKGQSEAEKLQREIEAREAQIKAWQQKATEHEETTKKIKARLQDDFLSRRVQESLLAAGASPQTITQAELVARAQLGKSLQVVEQDGDYKLSAVTADELQQPIELGELTKNWLSQNPHFAAPAPSGSGTTGATASPPQSSKTDITALGTAAAIQAGLAERAKRQE